MDQSPSESTTEHTSASRSTGKHVSRACLQCRSRHLKCDGNLPKCNRCTKGGKECSYVKSNRGGSRKKGVKKSNQTTSSVEPAPHPGDIEISSLPCSSGSGKEHGPCPNGHDKSTCGFLNDGSLTQLPCTSKDKRHIDDPSARTTVGIERNSHAQPAQKILTQQFNVSTIVHNYYTKFHKSHPVLPPLSEINDFLTLSDNPKELLSVMKVIGDGYTSSIYSKNINAVFDIAIEISDYINHSTKDVISLQTLILLSLLCHISALHDLSTTLRKQAIELAIKLDINNLDIDTFAGEDINGHYVKGSQSNTSNLTALGLTPNGSSSDEVNINFFNTKRVRALSEFTLKESARRSFWELFFLDIIIGCADGKTLSTLASADCFVKFPSTPSKKEFDYETRSSTSKLVDEAVRLNNYIFSNMSIGQQYMKLTASLSNWELKFSNPDFYKIPYLVDENGVVNEGIHQGIIMLNYAKIFTHRPLSFLWRSDVPRNLKCVEFLSDQLNKNDDNCQDLPNQKDMINSRKIIETRKTIDAANLIAKTLIDTNPVDILKRTPLSACSLAFAGLVHLSAYLWSTQIINSKDQTQNQPAPGDLNIYEEYMKLELSGIYQISSHFYLSSKIANYLMETVAKLLPNLHKKISANFQQFTEDQLPASIARSPTSFAVPVESTSSASSGRVQSHNPISMDMSYNIPSAHTGSSTGDGDEPMSPQSDTGCDWIDKNKLDFDFTNFTLPDIDLDALGAIDDMIKGGNSLFR